MLSHQHRGDGPHVTFMLHGFLGTGRNLASLARRWVEADPSRTLVMADMTGHGTSPPLPDPPNLEAVARDLLELMESAVGDEPAPVVGHSMGGRVALQARMLAPERVSSVTLLDISPSPIEPRVGSLEPVLNALTEAPATAESRDAMRQTLTGAGISRALSDWLLMNLMPAEGGGV
ncbi:MAG: alpha/beta fold hydrolase, partial [Myxococcota bacterium]